MSLGILPGRDELVNVGAGNLWHDQGCQDRDVVCRAVEVLLLQSVPVHPGMQNTGAIEPQQVWQPVPWTRCRSACPHPGPEESLAVSGGSSPVSLQGSGGAEGMFVQNGAGEDPGHWQGSALPSATLKVDKSHPASRAHHSPAELAQHPPGCQPSPKSGLRAQVPGLAGLPAPSLYPGEAPGWASSDVRNYSPGLLLLLW